MKLVQIRKNIQISKRSFLNKCSVLLTAVGLASWEIYSEVYIDSCPSKDCDCVKEFYSYFKRSFLSYFTYHFDNLIFH